MIARLTTGVRWPTICLGRTLAADVIDRRGAAMDDGRDRNGGQNIHDLHEAFSAPDSARLDDRVAFLHAADRLPGFADVRAVMRRLAAPPDGGVLLDAGCGLGLETERLAAAHPQTTVLGLDHDGEALATARSRADANNLQWRHGDVTALDLAPASVDVLRTERVLIYVEDLTMAVASIASVLRPGGVFAGFELDYGGTVLPPLGRPPEFVRRLTACLEGALPQTWAGRLLPEACVEQGLTVSAVRPHSFTVDYPVWSRIVAGTLRAALAEGRLDEPDVEGWIAELDGADDPCFRGAFIGVLTVASSN